MKDILTATWMQEMLLTLDNMYAHGWDERNGGNVSMLLEEEQVRDYTDYSVLRTFPLNTDASALKGKFFLVTGSGKYFKNALRDPERNLGPAVGRVCQSHRAAARRTRPRPPGSPAPSSRGRRAG